MPACTSEPQLGAGPQEEAALGDTHVGATQHTVTTPAPDTSFNKAEMQTHEHHEAWPTGMQRTRVIAHTGSAEGHKVDQALLPQFVTANPGRGRRTLFFEWTGTSPRKRAATATAVRRVATYR